MANVDRRAEYAALIPEVGAGNVATWRVIENGLLGLFGGYTCVPDIHGAWIDITGQVHKDVHREYRVALPADLLGNAYDPQPFIEYVLALGKALGQQSMYIRDPRGTVYIWPVDHAETTATRNHSIAQIRAM